MVSFRAIQSAFAHGAISKADYIEKMYLFHQHLFAYRVLIQKTDIDTIEITRGGVIVSIRGSGIQLFCPPFDQRTAAIEILNFRHYETDELRMILALVEKGSSVFDIGANIGWYTLHLCRLVPDVTVFAFEPIPQTFSYLKKNLELNRIDHAVPYNFGLSNKTDTVTFYYSPEGSGNASSAHLTSAVHVQTLSCPVRRIDAFVRRKTIPVDFIKCDVEGAELFVFQGGIETIATFKPIIFTEMLRKWTAAFHYHPNDTIVLLRRAGYRVFTIVGEKLREFSSMTDRTVETHFIFLHQEKHQKQIRRLKI